MHSRNRHPESTFAAPVTPRAMIAAGAALSLCLSGCAVAEKPFELSEPEPVVLLLGRVMEIQTDLASISTCTTATKGSITTKQRLFVGTDGSNPVFSVVFPGSNKLGSPVTWQDIANPTANNGALFDHFAATQNTSPTEVPLRPTPVDPTLKRSGCDVTVINPSQKRYAPSGLDIKPGNFVGLYIDQEQKPIAVAGIADQDSFRCKSSATSDQCPNVFQPSDR